MKPVCSIIIRAYNEEAHIDRLLRGILQQTVRDVQIILVDSGSTDRTVEIARQYPVEIVNIRPQDFTFGRSLNLGISHARADLVVMASAHVYPVYPDWLERLLEPFADEHVAVSYGKQRGADMTQFSEHQIFKHWFPDVSQPRQSHPFCNNANAAIRRALWERHPYNEVLPGLEDLAWARWAQEQGHGIAYVAEAVIIHVHQESLDGIFNRYRREGMAFKQIYPQETFTLADLARMFTGNLISDLRVAGREGKTWQQLSNIFRFRWLQSWGTYRGYNQSGPLTWQLKRAFYYPRLHDEPAAGPANGRDVEPIHYHDAVHTLPEKDEKR